MSAVVAFRGATHVVVGEDREKKRLRFEKTSHVAQSQAEMREPDLVDEHLRIFRFVACHQLLCFWIEPRMQQVDQGGREVATLRRCGGHAMVGGHRQQIVLSNLGLERADDARQIAVHLAKCEAQFV